MSGDCEDDIIILGMVSKCLDVMRGYSSLSKLTACYNLTERVLRLFSIQGSKEDVTKMINEFHQEIIKCVDEYYE